MTSFLEQLQTRHVVNLNPSGAAQSSLHFLTLCAVMALGLVALDVVLRERDVVIALPDVVRTIRRYTEAPLQIRLERALEKDDADLMGRILTQHEEDVRLDLLEESTLDPQVEQYKSIKRATLQDILRFGARHGREEIVKWVAGFPDQDTWRATYLAVSHGHLSIVKLLHRQSTHVGETVLMNRAARFGHLDILQWLYRNQNDPVSASWCSAVKEAAQFGHVKVLQWLYANNRGRSFSQTLVTAVEHGQLRVMEWVHDQSVPANVVGAMHAALKIGDTEMLEWLHDHYTSERCCFWKMDNAADGLYSRAVWWLRRRYPDRYIDAMVRRRAPPDALRIMTAAAILSYDVQKLQLTNFQPSRITPQTLSFATTECTNMTTGLAAEDVVLRERDAVAALLMVVRAIRRYAEAPLQIRLERALEKDDADLTERMLAQLREDERLDLLEGSIIEHSRAEQCEPVASTTLLLVLHFGARHGREEIVKWANGFPDQDTSQVITTAAINGHFTIVKLLHRNSVYVSEVYLMNTAVSHGHLDVLKWLYENRRDPSSACQPIASKDAGRLGYVDVLEWIYANNRVGFSPQSLAMAADHGQKRLMEWIFEQSIPVDVVGAMHAALEIGKTDMLEWLHNQYPLERCRRWKMDRVAQDRHSHVVQWLLCRYPERYIDMQIRQRATGVTMSSNDSSSSSSCALQ